MPRYRGLIAGAALAAAYGPALQRAVLWKLRRDVAALSAGDYRPLLSGFADDAELVFPEGNHRFGGRHRGRSGIEAFLRTVVAAGLQGEIREILVHGPPWRMTIAARFDDQARAADGELVYRNRTVLLARARWGKVVHQEDFFEDTGRIDAFEQRLRADRPRLVLVAIAEVPDSAVNDFDAYESLVLPLLPRHGGRLERRLRTDDRTREVHVISFASRQGYEAYLADPERSSHRALLAEHDVRQTVLEVTEVQPPRHDSSRAAAP